MNSTKTEEMIRTVRNTKANHSIGWPLGMRKRAVFGIAAFNVSANATASPGTRSVCVGWRRLMTRPPADR